MGGTIADFDTHLSTDASGTTASRDLILGLTTSNSPAGFPGMVAMSKIVPPEDAVVTFSQPDMFGTWRVYVQRVESKLAGSTTQIGQTTFGPSGFFMNGTLVDAGTPAISTNLATGNLLVATNGSVTGSLAVSTAATADRYSFIGSMRAAKDVITGVLTANLSARTATHYGLVTMVRDISLFDLSQPAYTVTEGNSLTATVKRTGNLTTPGTVDWVVNTASPGDFVAPTGGTLSFAAASGSATFTVKTTPNTLVEGNRSATIVLSAPTGPGAMLGSLISAPLNIVDEDKGGTFKLSAGTYAGSEITKTAAITITRTGGAASGIVVQFRTADDTAVANRDYAPYTATNGSVTFSATDVSKTVVVPIVDNGQVDGTRRFTFTLTNVSANAVLGSPATATVAIADNETGGTLQFSAATYSVPEGNVSTITVLRTGGTGGVLVDIATADGTGKAGHNYTTNTSTLTFLGGNTSATFRVTTLPDGAIEGDNTVLISLGNVRPTAEFTGEGAKLPVLGAIKNAVLTIKDAQKGVQFTSANYSVSETAPTATITLVRTGPLTDTATVRYSTSDGSAVTAVNYVPASGILTFGPAISTQSFTVKILPDKIVTTPKTVLLLLSSANSSVAPPVALGPRNSAVLTIGDTDVAGTVKIGTPAVSVNTGVGSAVVTITRSGGTAGGVTVDYATCDASTNPLCAGTAQAGIDYQAVSGTLTVGPGETTKTVLVVINADPTVKAARTFTLALANPQGGVTLGTPGQATVTINDAVQGGVVQLGATTFAASEPGGGNVSATTMITVKRSGTSLADGASVILLTGSGTAVPGMNYMPLATTVVFNGNETSQTIPLTVLANSANTGSGNLMVPVMLTGAAGGATLGTPASGIVTIMRANRSFQFSAPTTTVTEGAAATIAVLRGGPTTGAATVQWTASGDGTPGVDYKPASGTLSFAAGASSASFVVSTTATVAMGSNRSVNLTLTSPSAGYTTGSPATLLIQDRDAAGTFQFAAAASSVTEGTALTLTVNRTGGTGGTTTTVLVPWTVSAPTTDFAPPTFGTLTFGPGATSKTFMVTAAANTILDGNRSSTVTLGTPTVSGTPSGALGPQNTSVVTVLDRNAGGVIQFLNTTQVVAENVSGSVVNLALTRTGTNLAGGIQVDYGFTGDTSGIASGNSSVTLAPGATTASIPVTLLPPNGAAQPDRQLVVSLSNPRSTTGVGGPGAPTLGAKRALALTITDTLPHVSLSAASYSVTEGEPATLTVVRSGATTSALVVNYTTVDGTAVAGTHYTVPSGTVTVAAGATKATFPVATINGNLLTGSRAFVVGLTGVVNNTASIASPGQATVTILDKQSAGTIQFGTASASMLEGGVAHVTVTRSGANLVGGVTVGWSATGGTASPDVDFTPTSGTLTFDAGVASQSFDITSTGDGIATGTKTIVLSLMPPTGGAASGSPTATTIFVVDEEQSVGFASPTATVGETTAFASLQVARSGLPTGTVTVQFATLDGTAVRGLDYGNTSGTLTFGPGEIVKTLTIPIVTTNALTRNGNRALSVILSSPTGAALNLASTATLTILDFRADLVIASVAPPSGTLSGKSVSAPSTVRNLGPVAAPAFSVGIFIVRADAVDAHVPGAGSLVTTQSVSGLAAGASATFPTQFTIDDGFPAGDYFVSAIANFGLSVGEADTTNNGLSSVSSFTVSNNLTKFKSANAAFSQTSPPSGPRPPASAPLDVLTCNAQGSVNLTGTFQINSQANDTAQGQANLTGTLNGQPVQYLIGFTGTGDDSGNVTAVLNNLVFKSLTSALTGTGNGSLVGTLVDRTLVANVSGQFTGPLVGTCVFTGTLSALAQTSYSLISGTGVDNVSSFDFGVTPGEPSFPVGPRGAGVQFEVFFDTDYPDPGTVRVTGPTGSNITNKTPNPDESDVGSDHARYRVGNNDRGNLPGGTWTVLYKGQARTFTLAPFNANASFVVVFPSVNVDANDNLLSISWVYRSRLNGSVIAPPSFMSGIGVRVDSQTPGDQPRSPVLSPSVTTFTLADAGFTNVKWASVQGLQFTYLDLVGHLYEQSYGKAISVQLQPQVQNEYDNFNMGACTSGCVTRQLNVFVNTQVNLVPNTSSCPPFSGGQTGAPYFVQIQNHEMATTGTPNPLLPFNTPACLNFSGTQSFGNNSGPVDFFNAFINLDTEPGGPFFLMAGTKFDITVSTHPTDPTLNRQTIVVTLNAPEADPVNDVVHLSGLTGFRLVDARLGQPQTISWTPPSFPVANLFVNPNVYTSSGGQGPSPFCSVQMGSLDPAATQTTFTFPTKCNGVTPVQANVCVFYSGFNGETSDACWFWFGP